jgi:hypothetical protein
MFFGKRLSGRSGCGDIDHEERPRAWDRGRERYVLGGILSVLLVLACEVISRDGCATINLWPDAEISRASHQLRSHLQLLNQR